MATKPTDINSPPISLDDDEVCANAVDGSDAFAGLRRQGARSAPLPRQAKEDLRRVAETSPYVTTKTHRPDAHKARPAAPPPENVVEKVVRDGYSIPKADHEALERLAHQCMRGGYNIGKSGVLRLGVRMLAEMDEERLLKLAAKLPPVPTAKRKR